MNEDRWRRIEELYHAARLLTGSARVSFLAAATEGDEELRREVESLLVTRRPLSAAAPAVCAGSSRNPGDDAKRFDRVQIDRS